MEWFEFLILLVLFIVTGVRMFFRKKIDPDEKNENEEVLLNDTEILDYLYAKKTKTKKIKTKKISTQKKPAHLDKRAPLRASLDARHLQSKVEKRDEEDLLSDKFTEKQDIVSDHFQRADRKQIISDRFKVHPDKDAYSLDKKEVLTNLEKLVTTTSSPRDMIILHEILSTPKSLL